MQPSTIVRLAWAAALLLGAIGLISCSQDAQSPTAPVSVEVWHHGDVGTTLRFSAAIEKAVYGSPAFRRSSGRKPGTLIVKIPRTVQALDIRDREQLQYQVEFETSAGKLLGATTGACWSDELSVCANFVVDQAKLAASRIDT
jgi:hypothetical protein